jgi:hypothetical protein
VLKESGYHKIKPDIAQTDLATQDRAVVSSSTVFVQDRVCELQLLRATIRTW